MIGARSLTDNESVFRAKTFSKCNSFLQRGTQLFIGFGYHFQTVFGCHLRLTVNCRSGKAVFIGSTVFVSRTWPISRRNFPEQIPSLPVSGVIYLGLPHERH